MYIKEILCIAFGIIATRVGEGQHSMHSSPSFFFISHFLCVKDGGLWLGDFLNMGMTHNWEWELFEYIHSGKHRLPQTWQDHPGKKQNSVLKYIKISQVQVNFRFQVWSCRSWSSRSPESLKGSCNHSFWLWNFKF